MTTHAVGEREGEGVIFSGYPWDGVARLIDRAPSLQELREHRLQLIAAARLRERGAPVPPGLSDEVRSAHLTTLAARSLLHRVREVCTGPILVFKGLEAAAAYPGPALRAFADVDVLVPEPDEFQHQLLAAGFGGIGPALDWDALHHLQRLAQPDLPCSIEVHRHPKWVAGLTAPTFEELFAHAVPSTSGVDGVLAPGPAVHAVLLAAHAWAERPLRCIGDLVDVTVVGGPDMHGDAGEFASRHGLERVWTTTVVAAQRVLGDGGPTWPMRTWARHLNGARSQSVLESHLERVLAPLSGLSPSLALRTAGTELVRTVTPATGESWREKIARSRLALRDAFVGRSDHDGRLRDGEGRR